ncbi:YwqJ-related putative deaminase [Bacillus manliponensis]|uniref:YwqJ-related putative deaminase n=1 Tax=Bacillus manliponensis TaxID=574376 RepID=UPI000A5CE4A6|nr:YwqJ-related putative deaminase [Bacillus manliponensis]
MSLNMYIGEVQAQSESMNAFCNATIQGMEEVIRSIDAFALDVTLKGKTYDSAKAFFMQTYRQLAQGIIYLCEELIRQNISFPVDFQAAVATVDVIEQEIREQIRELERMIAAIAAMEEQTPGAAAMLQIYHAMKRKLEDKLERLYQFNYSSSENYRTALELASSIANGLAEVQSGKGFQAVSGTFHIEKLNMEWAKPIQVITEEKARKAENVVKDGEACERPELESEENNFDGKQLARDVTGEMTGEYDVRRVLEGIDPSNGEKLSTWNRFVAGGMVVAGVTPVGKLVKLGKAAKMTSEAVKGVNSSHKNLSRIEYLRNKYGKFTSQELNQRINLRGAVVQEVERLNQLGISKREMGPAVAGTFDKTTGKYYFGINNASGKIPEELHPLIKQRIINMPKNVKEGYTFTYGAGSHAEVYSLNKALLANPQASDSNFITHVVRSGKKLKPSGMMMPTCLHCNFITEGFEFSSEVKKIGKSN